MAAAPAADVAGDAAFEGCEHYKRRCQLLSACCNKFYTCRFCHDAVEDEGQRDVKKRHTMDRHAVRTVRCVPCGAVQPSAGTCSSCGVTLGSYFCARCNLFDNADRGQWHCDGCGICRVGGRANFRHCDRCAVCIGVGVWAEHTCVTDRLKVPCPICYEDLHSSRTPTAFLPCGHSMHGSCWEGMLKSGNPKCPMCSRSTVDMSRAWNERDLHMLASPMPQEYAYVWVRILCNDCHTESDARFHLDGFKCSNLSCGGYNTRKIGSATEAHPTCREEEAAAATESFNAITAALQARLEPAGTAERMPLKDVLHKIGRDAGGYTVPQRTTLLQLLQARDAHYFEEAMGAPEDDEDAEMTGEDAEDEEEEEEEGDGPDAADADDDRAAFLTALQLVMQGVQQFEDDAAAAEAANNDEHSDSDGGDAEGGAAADAPPHDDAAPASGPADSTDSL